MSRQLKLTKFRDLSISDPFFDSLKAGYREFPIWFDSKQDENVYIVQDELELSGMIYLKPETGPITDTNPHLPNRKWLKVGTLKIIGRGTKLGERVIKKIFDTALSIDADSIYVTIFDVHAELIDLFERYGFIESATKTTDNGTERVFVRDLNTFSGNLLSDYPFIHTSDHNSWLLAIYPEYHTRLLPDSILNNEPTQIIQDVSHTNTIHKVYISKLALTRMRPGDAVIFYRTTDHVAPARFRSVVTSVCVVEEVRPRRSFASLDDFLSYTRPRSVFDDDELRAWYAEQRMAVAKLTYNAAFNRRITRGQLIDDGLVSEQPRWDLRALPQTQFRSILALGGVNARLIID